MSTLFTRMEDRALACWDKASKKKKVRIYIGVYTVVFAVVLLLAYSPFLLDHITIISSGDNRRFDLPFFVYLGRYLRQVASNLLKGELSIPLFEICMGEGSDIIGSLLPWGALEPLRILQAFVPTKYAEVTYTFLTVFHMYLAGLSFSYLCVYFHKRVSHTLIGSVVYVFCGYAIVFSLGHQSYLDPMVVLPLMIVGVDKTICKKRPYLLIFSTMYGALCSYYFLYMMAIMIALYALVRFFDIYHERRWKEFFSAVGRSLRAFLIGIGLSAVVFIPAVAVFLSCSRSGYSHYQGPYTLRAILVAALRFISPISQVGVGSVPAMAFAAIVLLALALLLCSRKKRRSIKVFSVIAVFSLFSSVFALMMNGFQYSNCRFTFGVALVMAYLVVEMLPELLSISKAQKWICILVLCGYTVIALFPAATRSINYLYVGAIFLALTVLLLTAFSEWKEGTGATVRSSFRTLVCLILVIANVGINAIYRFVPDKGNFVSGHLEFGGEIKFLEDVPERELEPYLLGNPDGRADGTSFETETALPWHIPTLLYYNSVTNGYVADFWKEIENPGQDLSYRLRSTDQRAATSALFSVKYQVEAENKAAYVPFGYEAIETTEKGNIIFENQYALPWGYTYDVAITYDDLAAMNGLQKQQAMLQAVALEDGKGPERLDAASLTFDEKSIPFEITCKNCTWEDGYLKVSKAKATMTLRFDMQPNVECYVRLTGFVRTGLAANTNNIKNIRAQVKPTDISQTLWMLPDTSFVYYGKVDYLTNFGYSDEARNELIITFPETGTYKLDDIELYALSLDNYPEQVEALRAEPMENIRWGTNSLTGTVDLSKDKILCVSVPYSKGWTAKVDGVKTEILRGNYMFMCLPLMAGHHDIEFRYCSPGLRLGLCITILSLCAVGVMLAREKRGQRARFRPKNV